MQSEVSIGAMHRESERGRLLRCFTKERFLQGSSVSNASVKSDYVCYRRLRGDVSSRSVDSTGGCNTRSA